MKKLLFFLLITLFWASLNAQKSVMFDFKNEKVEKVLDYIENNFDVSFSYKSSLLKNKKISLNDKNNLDEVLMLISNALNIKIDEISSKRYVIIEMSDDLITSDTEDKIFNLDEIVISDYITKGVIKSSEGAIIFSPKKLKILPGLTEPDVLQSLQSLPGINSPDESASGLQFRGGTSDQNLILWDDIKIYHSGHFFGNISAFNPYITQDVKVYRSGTSAKYGDRVSGVIDISTTDYVPAMTEVGIGFNLTHVDGYIKSKLSDNIGFIFSARRSFSDIWPTITYESLSDKIFQNTRISSNEKIIQNYNFRNAELVNKFYFTDYNVKFIWEPSIKDKVFISGLFVKNSLDYSAVLEVEKTQDNLDLTNFGFSAVWERDFNESWKHRFKTYFSDYNLDFANSAFFKDQEYQRSEKSNNLYDFGLDYSLSWNINENNSFLFGYELVTNDIDYSLKYADFIQEDYSETESAPIFSNSLYVEYKLKKEEWNLTAGTRNSYLKEQNKIYVEPRISLGYKISDNKEIKASFEEKNQFVSQLRLDSSAGLGVGEDIWMPASDELGIPVVNNKQFTLGYLYEKNNWKIDLEAYYKRLTGITSFSRNNGVEGVLYSYGDSESLGFDVLIKKRINNYRTWISYSLARINYFFDEWNNGASFPADNDKRHIVNWSHSLETGNFQFSLGWNFSTGSPYTEPTDFIRSGDDYKILWGERNDKRLSDYHRLDFSVVYNFKLNKHKDWDAKLGLSVLNLYDQKNTLERYYDINYNAEQDEFNPNEPEEENLEIREVDKIGLGITPNIVFRITF